MSAFDPKRILVECQAWKRGSRFSFRLWKERFAPLQPTTTVNRDDVSRRSPASWHGDSVVVLVACCVSRAVVPGALRAGFKPPMTLGRHAGHPFMAVRTWDARCTIGGVFPSGFGWTAYQSHGGHLLRWTGWGAGPCLALAPLSAAPWKATRKGLRVPPTPAIENCTPQRDTCGPYLPAM